jgi:hypothetical protein
MDEMAAQAKLSITQVKEFVSRNQSDKIKDARLEPLQERQFG